MDHSKARGLIEKKLGADGVELFDRLMAQEPQQADTIVFLQGDQLDRAPAVEKLWKRGLAPLVLITGNNDLIGRGKRNEECDFHLDKLKGYLLERGIPNESILMDDQAFNTPDQAIHAIEMARKHGWKTLLIITSPYHILRAYLTCLKQVHEQEWSGGIIMHVADLAWERNPSGRERPALEMLDIELDKIEKYQKDLANVSEGLKRFR